MNSEKRDSAFVERLKLLLNGAKPYPWAAKVGITQATFNRMWKDGIAPKADILLLISESTGCSIDWLLTGKGQMKRGQEGYSIAEGLQNADASGERPEAFEPQSKKADRSPVKAAAVSYIDEMTDAGVAEVIRFLVPQQTEVFTDDIRLKNLSPEGKARVRAAIEARIKEIEDESVNDHVGQRLTGS